MNLTREFQLLSDGSFQSLNGKHQGKVFYPTFDKNLLWRLTHYPDGDFSCPECRHNVAVTPKWFDIVRGLDGKEMAIVTEDWYVSQNYPVAPVLWNDSNES